ncbi:MAG: helix-turn-helix transcriptional regulator [bacterium]
MLIQKIVGDNIRGYRKKIQWTQEKLSVRSKISSPYISRIEKGHENPSVSVLATLANTLKVELFQFFIKESYKD